MEPGRTRYVHSGDGYIAYQVRGDGPLDLAVVGNWAIQLEDAWEHYKFGPFLARLTCFARVLVFDQRGTGLSDPVSIADMTPIERWTDQVGTVLDAAGMQDATIIGFGGGGYGATLFAASHPQRTRSLVLISTAARLIEDVDYPWGIPRAEVPGFLARVEAMWGTGEIVRWTDPEVADDPALLEQLGAYERRATGPAAIAAAVNMVMQSDLRGVLPSVRVPTLVVHRQDDRFFRVEHGRFLAQSIAGARYTELPGHAGIPDVEIADEIEEFVTGTRQAQPADRVLATVVFTDIVGSTTRLAELGDRRWREILDRHDDIVARAVERYRGRKVNATGDGILAVFDGPHRAVECACAIRDGVTPLGIAVRAGIHTGEVELRGDDIAGIAVHLGARVAALAKDGEVLVTRTVTDLVVGSGLRFVEHGEHELKGVPGRWQVFAVTTND